MGVVSKRLVQKCVVNERSEAAGASNTCLPGALVVGEAIPEPPASPSITPTTHGYQVFQKSRDRLNAAESPLRRVGLDGLGLLDERRRLGDVAAEDVALDEVGEPDL